MPPFGPIGRREFIRALQTLGFEGPFSGGKHQFMVRANVALRVPNPHSGDIAVGLLARILKQAGISRKEWEAI